MYGGHLHRLGEDALIVLFGNHDKYLPPQVSALLATHAGLDIIEYIDWLNNQTEPLNPPVLRVGISVFTGAITSSGGNLQKEQIKSGYQRLFLFGRHILSLSNFLKSSGMLICENTKRYLDIVQKQFEFGIQGPVSLPKGERSMMVYQILGRSIRLLKDTDYWWNVPNK